MKWEVVEKSVSLGGLEIGNLKTRNKTFLAKWLWRFYVEPNSPWHGIILSKHSPHPFKWLAEGGKGTYQNLWKVISKSSLASFLGSVVWWGMGEMYFWEDHWVGEHPLFGAFPRLYNLSSLKNNFVYDFLVWTGSSCSFFFGFHCSSYRQRNDGCDFSSFASRESLFMSWEERCESLES